MGLFEKKAIANFWKQNQNTWGMCLPQGSIYHYTSSVKVVENILTEGELRLSKSTVMNDFSEIKYGCDLFTETVKKAQLDTDLETLLLDNISNAVNDNIFGDVFILCFSLNGNSRLLWDSYSRKTGYNIEISPNFIEDFITNAPLVENHFVEDKGFIEKVVGHKIQLLRKEEIFTVQGLPYSLCANRVLYDQDLQLKVFQELLEVVEEEHRNNNYLMVNVCLAGVLDFIPFFKDPTLKEEEEYRLVIRVIRPETNGRDGKKQYLRPFQHYREFENKLFPYIKIKMNSKEYIKNVSMGYCNSDDLSYETLADFISTLSEDIGIKKTRYALRW